MCRVLVTMLHIKVHLCYIITMLQCNRLYRNVTNYKHRNIKYEWKKVTYSVVTLLKFHIIEIIVLHLFKKGNLQNILQKVITKTKLVKYIMAKVTTSKGCHI